MPHAHRVQRAACCSLARGQTCTGTFNSCSSLSLVARARETVGERSKGELERGREKEGERVRASIWPGSVWEVKDSNVGYILYGGTFVIGDVVS